ncbi:MAG: D-alanyl-D-alanine carboxypeptidase [Clostridia bacterium]|nr:D-alanyl-D-alanine carboxypeptidase [Clostridia bacterium]
MKYLKNITIIFILLTIFCTSSVFSTGTVTYTNLSDITTYSPCNLLMESKTGKVIYEKNGYEKMYPASTTKIMTAILTLEHCELTDVATASYEAVFTVPVGYTNANIQVGEELTVNQLLHVLLINSANEAANVLAEHIAGSVESFATMMNTKAEEIGCLNTHFVNPNGVHNENHYSTAYDLAIIGKYAMQNETFREIVNTTFYTLPATNKYPTNDRVFGTTNELIKKDTSDKVDNYYYEYATGAKTGYTNAAKNCIVATAKKDDIEYIVVILGAETTENGLSARYLDCKNLFNYAFENYKVKTINEKGSILKKTKIAKANISTKQLNIVVEDEISLLLKKDTDINTITPTVELNSDLKAPISKNTVIGKITYEVDGNTYTSNLLAGGNLVESNAFNTFLTIASIILVLFLLFKLLKSNNNKKKKRKKKQNNSRYSSKGNYLYW